MCVGVEREELPRVVGLVVDRPGKDVFVSRPQIWGFNERLYLPRGQVEEIRWT